VALTHTGIAAACLTRNDGSHVYIATEGYTFSDEVVVGIALWADRSLVDLGLSIYRYSTGCSLSKHSWIGVGNYRAICMNRSTRPGAFLLNTTVLTGRVSPRRKITPAAYSTRRPSTQDHGPIQDTAHLTRCTSPKHLTRKLQASHRSALIKNGACTHLLS
jgi:hypothetical protein